MAIAASPRNLVLLPFSSARRSAAPGGSNHPQHPGAHDDFANAVCGAFVMLERDRRPQLISGVDVARRRCRDRNMSSPPSGRRAPTSLWCTALHPAGRKSFSSSTSPPFFITSVFSPTLQPG